MWPLDFGGTWLQIDPLDPSTEQKVQGNRGDSEHHLEILSMFWLRVLAIEIAIASSPDVHDDAW